jgi:hypothetical protein
MCGCTTNATCWGSSCATARRPERQRQRRRRKHPRAGRWQRAAAATVVVRHHPRCSAPPTGPRSRWPSAAGCGATRSRRRSCASCAPSPRSRRRRPRRPAPPPPPPPRARRPQGRAPAAGGGGQGAGTAAMGGGARRRCCGASARPPRRAKQTAAITVWLPARGIAGWRHDWYRRTARGVPTGGHRTAVAAAAAAVGSSREVRWRGPRRGAAVLIVTQRTCQPGKLVRGCAIG